MGIGAKRTVAELQGKMATWEADLKKAAKADFTIEVDFDSLVDDDNCHYALDSFERIFIRSPKEAFEVLCADSIGAEAVAKNLKKIIFTNKSKNKTSANWASYKDGTLTLDHWMGNADFFHDRKKALVSLLEKSL